MPVVVRFAPAPTGLIHIGNVRTAVFNWLIALAGGGQFILRFDDTDAQRSRPEHADAIEADLGWLGILPDAVTRQSDRLARYRDAAEQLKATGRLYPCFETPQELERRRLSQRRRGQPPVYDRAALRLSDAERGSLLAAGAKPHWRFRLGSADSPAAAGEIAWEDLFRGRQTIDLSSLSDPILVREDGTFLYTLPSVVDDIDMAISHVVRGEDHVTNTAVQIELFAALAAAPPKFGHHNLLVAAGGEGLSKRTGALSVAALRRAGYEPMAVASLAALIGTSETVEPAVSFAELAARFAPGKVSRAPARFDPAELASVNARLLHRLPFAAVEGRLAALGIAGGEAFWLAVRENCAVLPDALGWWRIVAGDFAAVSAAAEDEETVRRARDLVPAEPWDRTTFASWMGRVKAATGRPGRGLFQPVRRALTGLDHGPELAGLLPLIGRSNTLARLDASLPRP